MMITRCEINDKAIKIFSNPYSVRALVKGDKTFFSVNDILYACGIKAPIKWIERNAEKYAWMWTDSFPYPTKTSKGWRMNKVRFVTCGVGKRIVRLTVCPEPVRSWLLNEVLVYHPRRAVKEDEAFLDETNEPADQEIERSGDQDSLSVNGFIELYDRPKEQDFVTYQKNRTYNNQDGVEQIVDDIISGILELDLKEYGHKIDHILLRLLDLKRTFMHTKAG